MVLDNENGKFGINIKKDYFIGVKFGYALLMTAYIMLQNKLSFFDSAEIFIVSAVCAAVMSLYEILNKKLFLLVFEWLAVTAGIFFFSNGFIMLLPVVISDTITRFNMPLYSLLSPLACIIFTDDKYMMIVLCLLTAVIYYQHYGLITSYRKSNEDYEQQELQLKNSIDINSEKFKNEIKRTNLYYENMMLQDKARLSQELHDKLGHRVNGSIYQLEACRLIISSDPEKSEEILKRVIDSLRTGMDDIRALLRKERPDSKRVTLLQLTSLCNDCREQYGITANLSVTGESDRIDEKSWRIILDNCCEAVTNSLKYSSCDRIDIEISVLNKILRCCVSDNGKGCDSITDGMGLQGMKQRIASVGGIINIDGTSGFTINMLIPIE